MFKDLKSRSRASAVFSLIVLGVSVSLFDLHETRAGLVGESLAVISVIDVDNGANSLEKREAFTSTQTFDTDSNPSPGVPGTPRTGTAVEQSQMLVSATASDSSGMDGMAGELRGRSRRRGTDGIPGAGNGSGNGSGTAGAGGIGAAGAMVAAISPASNNGGAPTASNAAGAIMPTSVNGGTYLFVGTSNPGVGGTSSPLTFDPPLDTAFLFATQPGSPNFASIQVTNPLPNTSLLSVTFNGQTDTFAPGTVFNFLQFDPNGVSQFLLSGISPLDVQTGAEFLSTVTFTQPGQFAFTETGLPEPASLTLLAVGAVGLLGWRGKHKFRPSV